jgi:hypothetical protein
MVSPVAMELRLSVGLFHKLREFISPTASLNGRRRFVGQNVEVFETKRPTLDGFLTLEFVIIMDKQ